MVQKIATYVDTFFLEKADIPLPQLLESKRVELMENAPLIISPSLSVEVDGRIVGAEIVDQDGEIMDDELVLRKMNGSHYADSQLQKANAIMQDISRIDQDVRVTSEQITEVQTDRNDFLKQTPLLHQKEREAKKIILWFLFLAFGEVGWNVFLFADLLGLDLTRLHGSLLPNLIKIFAVFSMSIGLFGWFLYVSEKIKYSTTVWQRILWILGLIVPAFLVATFREQQTSALQSANTTSFQMIVLFTFIAAAIAWIASNAKICWDNARKFVEESESRLHRLGEIEIACRKRISESLHEREGFVGKLRQIIEEYRMEYRNFEREKEELERRKRMLQMEYRKYEQFIKSRLSQFETAYKFWYGWRRREKGKTHVIRRLVPVAIALAFVLFLFAGCGINSDNSGFNLTLLADRSSSGSDFSCNKMVIEKGAKYWLSKADESGSGCFKVYLIGDSFDDTPIFFSEEYPEQFPGPILQNKRSWRERFEQRLSEKLQDLPSDRGSAIAEAIFRASLGNLEKGHTLFMVATDLRQVNVDFNFEKTTPTFEKFSSWLDKNNISPRFGSSTAVIICGVHPNTPENTSKMNPKSYVEIINLWTKVFQKWGITPQILETWNFPLN